MRRTAGRAVIALGVPFAIALLMTARALHRRLPWHPLRTLGRTAVEGRARYDEYFSAFEQIERRAERSMLGNLLEDSLPALLGLRGQPTSSKN